MLLVYNPTSRPIQKIIPLDLYYTGSVGPAAATHPEGYTFKLPFDRRCRSSLAVEVPPGEMVYYTIR
jgi:hypothetical protein